MRTIDLLTQVCSECLNLEKCFVWRDDVHSGNTFEHYFGKPFRSGNVVYGRDYFCYYGTFDETFSAMVAPDGCLSGGDDDSVVYMWVLE